MKQRLVKAIAHSGVASRRKAGDLVKEGRVTVNGQLVTNPAQEVDPFQDHIKVDKKLLTQPSGYVYLILNKLPGYVTTLSDPENRPTVMDLVRTKLPVFPVGRLDMDSEGLLLFTNDGDLAQHMSHPKYGIRKVYRVKVKGQVRRPTLEKLRAGIKLKEGVVVCQKAEVVSRGDANCQLHLIVSEGYPRMVRRMMEQTGHPVIRLVRERFGPLQLEDLKPGKFRFCKENEVAKLKKLLKE